jgi:thioredoxin reductase (NADPH)
VHRVWVGDEEHQARTVILAMGAEHRKLGIPGEQELGGRGVSYCATCDAAFFKDKNTVIVGGGDSAMEEAIFLSKFASKVTVVHRRDEFRASRIMFDRAKATGNIEFLTPYVVEEFAAQEDGALPTARLRNVVTGETRELPDVGTFIAIGHEPQSEIVAGQVRTDDEGYVITEGRSTRTGLPACSPPATSSTTPTGRPSRPRARLPGRARRGVVPARHARGAHAAGAARGRPGRGAVGADAASDG